MKKSSLLFTRLSKSRFESLNKDLSDLKKKVLI